MKRRDFLRITSAAALAQGAIPALSGQPFGGQMQTLMPPPPPAGAPPANAPGADVTLRIAPVTVALAPDRILSTIGYNGSSPGPVLRFKEGKPVTVDVINDTDVPELVHWHGLLIPSDVDGVEEQGTPLVPPHGSRRYSFTPTPAGSRWYHSHAMAMGDLHRGAFTGQFGFVYIDPAAGDPGHYDQELFLALRDWEPFYTSNMDDDDDDSKIGPQPEKPAVLNTDANGLEVNSLTYSINDKALGAGEPIRVKQGERLLIHFLNASAIENRRISLTGHKMRVIVLDGNPVPNPAEVDALFIGAGERVCVTVDMNNPGIWVLGSTTEAIRTNGLGIIVEYAGQHTQPKWTDPSKDPWDYTLFAKPGPPAAIPTQTIEMIFEKIPRGAGQFNSFLVNGKPYPHDNEFVLKQGQRYRLIFRNRTDDAHPLHLHRHLMELVEIDGKQTNGLLKDTIVVPYYGRAIADFTAANPGLTLFHCHIQQHMDYGFKALFRYA